MQIAAAGSSPVKGLRHLTRDTVELTADGPAGDRMFAVVDLERARVLRTVDTPSLLACVARVDDGTMSIEIGGCVVTGELPASGVPLELDYWGRPAAVEVLDGPWSAAFSEYLGREVSFARARAAGEVVYGASVTILGTASLRQLEERVGAPVDSRRFRANLVVDTDEPFAEDDWDGRELTVGTARLRVRQGIDRCAVIDVDPDSGVPGTGPHGPGLLKALAGFRRRATGIRFGVFADVVSPGVVRVGDTAQF